MLLSLMKKVSVIGAGRLGSTIAFSIAKERVVEELVIIDIIENLVKGEGLDLGQYTQALFLAGTPHLLQG